MSAAAKYWPEITSIAACWTPEVDWVRPALVSQNMT